MTAYREENELYIPWASGPDMHASQAWNVAYLESFFNVLDSHVGLPPALVQIRHRADCDAFGEIFDGLCITTRSSVSPVGTRQNSPLREFTQG